MSNKNKCRFCGGKVKPSWKNCNICGAKNPLDKQQGVHAEDDYINKFNESLNILDSEKKDVDDLKW